MNNTLLCLVKMNSSKVINPPDNERRPLLKFTMQISRASGTVLCASVLC